MRRGILHPPMQYSPRLFLLRPAQLLHVNSKPQRARYASMSAQSAPKAAESDAQAADVANTSGVSSKSLQTSLEGKLEAQHVDIQDMSGDKGPSRKCLSSR